MLGMFFTRIYKLFTLGTILWTTVYIHLYIDANKPMLKSATHGDTN